MNAIRVPSIIALIIALTSCEFTDQPVFVVSGSEHTTISVLAALGDADFDGIRDFMICYASTEGKREAVTYSGKHGGVIRAWSGDSLLGQPIAVAGDVDGDGYMDLMCIGDQARTMIVSSGRDNSLVASFSLLGDLQSSVFAFAAGDLDSDGHADIALRSGPSFRIVSGRTQEELAIINLDNPESQADGTWLSPLGDVNADGNPDVVVWTKGGSGAYVYSGGHDNMLLLTVPGRVRDVVFLGDLDSDNHAEFLVSMVEVNYLARVLVISGSDGSVIRSIEEKDDFFGAFGTRITSLGDVNGDRIPDFAIGDYSYDRGRPGKDYGRVIVYSGKDCRSIETFFGVAPHGWFGLELVGVGGMNSDSMRNLLVSARSEKGVRQVLAFSLTDWNPLRKE